MNQLFTTFTFLFMVSVSICGVVAEENSQAKSAEAISVSLDDWPWWRGPNRNGIAPANQNPPLKWSEKENVIWKANVPGRGHGSPIVVGNQIFLATADLKKQTQSVMCIDRKTGKQLWKTDVHISGLKKKGNRKASLASSSLACDGKRLFINFINSGGMTTSALTWDGKILWQTKITDYIVHQGFGSSPAVYGPLVIVSADNKGGGAIAGLNRASGKIVWKKTRPKTPNYASPIILKVAGRDQLLFTGCNLVSGYEPLTGKKLWEIKGATTECVTSTVTDGKVIITSGGYPKNHVAAVRADGSGEIAWEKKVRVYVPSMLIHKGFLYGVTDAGVAMCWDCKTGDEKWKGRLGGTFSASPVLADGHIFATNEGGRTYIFKANANRFQLVGKNDLGSQVFATPTICGSRVYLRVATQKNGQRQEVLYCLGREK